jgi:hypothetical protein
MKRFAVALVMVAVALALDGVTDAGRRVIDLTQEQSLSLTDQTKQIAGAVRQKTTVTAFLSPDDPERAPAAALLLRYHRLNRRITFRLLDPQRATGEMRRLGVDPGLGGIGVSRGAAVEVVPTLTEQDITGALARLARGRSATVCVAGGHGEPSLDDTSADGLSEAGGLLRSNGYELRTIDLLVSAVVPAECDGVVLVRPTTELGGAGDGLRRWVEEGEGRLLVLADPVSTVDISPVVAGLGLGVRRGIVLEGDAQSSLPNDPTSPIVHTYSSASPIVRRLAPTFFPAVEQVVVGESDPANGLTVSRLADTSRVSYLETEPLTSTFDPSTDVPGPITVAAAADRSRQSGGAVHRSRVVIVGDADFATNIALHEAGNSTFLVRSLDWLTLDDQLVVLSANLPRDRTIALTRQKLTYARFLSLGLLPGLFLLAGVAVWLVRRPR